MPARIIHGKALAQSHRDAIARRAGVLRSLGRPARLDALLASTGDTAARQYADSQSKTCAQVGIDYRLHDLSHAATFDDIAGRILLLNTQDEVSAIMVHMPLPEGIDPYSIQRLIAPEKDVEGVNPANIGNVVYGRSSLAPCTALATIKMIESTGVEMRGRTAIVIGASNVVGKPIAVLLMRQDAMVISCNKFSDPSLMRDFARRADILIAAAGAPELITADMIRPRRGEQDPGAVVIDVGVNRVKDASGSVRTVGDVAFGPVAEVAGFISPVPGGVGPMTVAMLLLNVVQAAEHAAGIRAAS